MSKRKDNGDDNPREWGLGSTDAFIRGVPKLVRLIPEGELPPCPTCGGRNTYAMIEIPVEHPMLRGGKGLGTYVGCAACPWASPLLMTGSF